MVGGGGPCRRQSAEERANVATRVVGMHGRKKWSAHPQKLLKRSGSTLKVLNLQTLILGSKPGTLAIDSCWTHANAANVIDSDLFSSEMIKPGLPFLLSKA